MLKTTRALAASLIFASCNTFAVPVTLQSNWNSSLNGNGVLTFTYESTTADSNADPLLGQYSQAITALDFVFSGSSYTLDNSAPNSISLKVQQQSGENIKLLGTLLGNDGKHYNMFLGLEIYSLWNSGTDSLTTLIGAEANENASIIWEVGTNSGAIPRNSLLMQTPFTQVSSVPVPAAAWLFASGMMGLAAARRRK